MREHLAMVQRGRPPLGPDEVTTKIRDYCARYRVTPGPDGMPPFPSGRRETPQHREWLTVYRAHQRLRRRQAAAPASDAGEPASAVCAVCARQDPRLGALLPYRLDGRGEIAVHARCADLLRQAEAAGQDAVARAASLLWPAGRGR